MRYTAASHQEVIEMFWLRFLGAVMLSIFMYSNFIIIKHTSFKVDRSKIKLTETVLVPLSTVSTITNSVLLKINP